MLYEGVVESAPPNDDMTRNLITAVLVSLYALTSCGGGGGSPGGGGGVPSPAAPSGLAATGGNAEVSLTWNASTGATSYNVKRATASGGPYSTISSPATTSYTDSGLTNGTTYYYVVSAVNSGGESANSSQVSATPSSTTAVNLTVDVLSDRHAISPYVYGWNFPNSTADITDSGTTFVRWGGDAASRYNWMNHAYNAANDYYYEDYPFSALDNSADSDSEQFVRDVLAAGSTPLMTMVMLDWVAKDTAVTSHSFSVAKYGPQCKTDLYNSDAGDGLKPDCVTDVTGNDPNDANVPIHDAPATGDPAGTVYRNQWAMALATDFGTAPHFYDMDNEMDIWGNTHRDVHPNPSTDEELRDTYLSEAVELKTWDPAAIRFGPVTCCWEFYWNPAAGPTDKAANGNIDFMPWWLNEIYWSDLAAGARSLEVFDFHGYTEDTATGLTLAQQQALALRATRDWWDPTYTSEAWFGSVNVLNTDPMPNVAFRLPRLRALVNTIYPGTLLSSTEWSFAFAGESDFSTALADADAYGILGRERMYAAARWTAPMDTAPAYQALKLYRNYDGAHHTFGTLSVSATHNANPSLFSAYAALDSTGTVLTVMVVNKDPGDAAQVQFALNGFAPAAFASYTLSQASRTTIVASASQPWVSTQTFSPYSATLLVINGTMTQTPGAEWDLNPESIMVPAGGAVTLQPKLISGSGAVTLSSPQFDSGISSMTITNASVTSTSNGAITVAAGSTPGFYHFTLTGTDIAGVAQKQGGWIVVNFPAATLTKTGDGQSAPRGTLLNLSVTFNPGSSGGTNTGAPIFFTADAGSVSQKLVATDSSGNAAVVLTLPSSPGTVHVTAEGPYGVGHPVATFTETSQ